MRDQDHVVLPGQDEPFSAHRAESGASAIPAPRLQLRWELGDEANWEWHCHYELVLPLREHDIRREVWADGDDTGQRLSELVIPMSEGYTRRGSSRAPCETDSGGKVFDTPYRDGAHASWDAAQLGGLPTYAIAPDGTAILKPTPEQSQ